ncbi:MAG: deoxyribodipyrimidine photo-lyase [Bdellovibrionales bacterium]|nr:deoxyribodipyrimidine photo-lyase [Bdellovibrionales bacterium]
MSDRSYGLHWFRRDLRLEGNPALARNLALHPGRVLGVFCFDRKFLSRPDFSAARFLFFLRTLEKLRAEMRERGGDLLFLDEGPRETFPALLASLRELREYGRPATVSWNRDYEPFARERDAAMQSLFEEDFGVESLTERDHLLIEPTELARGDAKAPGGGFYQVYTPFKAKWFSLFRSSDVNARLRETGRALSAGAPAFSLAWPKSSPAFPFGGHDLLAEYLAATRKLVPPALASGGPRVGHAAAKEHLRGFRDEWLAKYAEARDFPAVPGTSQMSIYLKNGSITVPQIVALLKLTPDSPEPELKYFQELVWREFYYHILYHRPEVEREAFLPKYRNLRWENSEKLFRAWCEGRTGYPIVDAGMRQLNATGWMHNRVRMIVASFLTKELLVDYRWGERYFMEKLLDGDLAPNNGGWQWAASTGCDPQPYFRIFNPTSQGERFDPDGKYVRRWLPELADRPDRELHEPLDPLVDHAKQRERALALFKSAREE